MNSVLCVVRGVFGGSGQGLLNMSPNERPLFCGGAACGRKGLLGSFFLALVGRMIK